MTLSLDGAPDVREQECSCCGATFVVVDHFILMLAGFWTKVRGRLEGLN
jgi:hypothetical protein